MKFFLKGSIATILLVLLTSTSFAGVDNSSYMCKQLKSQFGGALGAIAACKRFDEFGFYDEDSHSGNCLETRGELTDVKAACEAAWRDRCRDDWTWSPQFKADKNECLSLDFTRKSYVTKVQGLGGGGDTLEIDRNASGSPGAIEVN